MPIDVEIVSPEKRLLARSVDMVVVPGSEGDLAAMPEHAPMIVMLRGGVVSLHEGSQVTDRFFVAGGFAEITGERCTILADEATPLERLSRADGETRLRDAEAAYDAADKSDITSLEPLLERIQSARAQVEAASV
ncbi:ATP synthase F1 subunit epsilon [Rhizosaccharibacter radicis]|uniref:ATP synthase epsilon chain n=1 Tax=Rhizosaccharibacter radicis TaxID=2782605 RepID=A0ABT1VZP5_9PROT|nr:ATP synthase F1 subunit epsilon [Acetobacteraceae bacterium KSS12]